MTPLPIFYPFPPFAGQRIASLPTGFLAWALRREGLPPLLMAALVAETGFRVMALDQTEGR